MVNKHLPNISLGHSVKKVVGATGAKLTKYLPMSFNVKTVSPSLLPATHYEYYEHGPWRASKEALSKRKPTFHRIST
ncbi:MAG: hypothetical protein V3V02_10825 [Rhizobiaceae bacterium]